MRDPQGMILTRRPDEGGKLRDKSLVSIAYARWMRRGFDIWLLLRLVGLAVDPVHGTQTPESHLITGVRRLARSSAEP
jgi:hypothetical protein